MARITINLPKEQLARLARIAKSSGRSKEETASDLVGQALDPWVRAWAIIEEAREKSGLSDLEAQEVALAE